MSDTSTTTIGGTAIRGGALQGGSGPVTQASEEPMLTRAQVARILGVSPTTVTRWAREGRLACRMTLGGHHRFSRVLIEQIRSQMSRG